MVFSSVSFLVYFLPILLILYYLVPGKFRGARNFVLLVASIIFYGWGGPKFLLLLMVSVIINYICGYFAGTGKTEKVRKISLITAVILGLGLLGWFKYAGFFAETLNLLGLNITVPNIVLPIGISFFTFQGLSYVIDVYRKQAQVQKNPLNVALYIALFPQLVAGPIVRYQTVADEIEGRQEKLDDFSKGLVRFLIGLGKKMLLANAMGEVADAVFGKAPGNISTALAWVGAISYTFQIYFDFSAYSDMAIGLGKMFGFNFLENFNYPYIAKSITDFWRRWHISLSSWFRDYVYIPLGGNRCSKGKNIRNIAVVWILTGLWHGANWTFIFWGVWFLLLLLGEKFIWGNGLKKLPAFFGHVYTLLAVIVSWVLFRADSLGIAVKYLGTMLGITGTGFMSGEAVYYIRLYLPWFIVSIIASLPLKTVLERYFGDRCDNKLCCAVMTWFPKIYALAILAVSYMKLVTGSFNPFIYFQF